MSCGSNETDVVAIDCPSANQTDGPAELYYSTEEPTTLARTTAETIYANVSEAANWTEMLTTASAIPATGSGGGFGAEVMIPLYSVIFILSIVGNILVIVTLTQNRRMRTVTNVFLLNLAVADLLLGVFCMPFTLIGQLLRDFIFGSFMCKIIPYFQAVSVAVGVWTLVAISLERYFAICRPLKSRIWQTRSHAYKMIIAVWILSLSFCLPVAVLSRLKPIRDGRHKCREEWPDVASEQAYNLLLDVILLVLPLLIMGLAYWLIAARLWRGLRHETTTARAAAACGGCYGGGTDSVSNGSTTTHHNGARLPAMIPTQADTPPGACSSTCSERGPEGENLMQPTLINNGPIPDATKAIVIQWPVRSNHRRLCCQPSEDSRCGPSRSHGDSQRPQFNRQQSSGNWRGPSQSNHGSSQRATSTSVQIMDYRLAARYGVRSTYTDKSVWAKKKVIRMLFVIVFEFFLCWAPLYVVNTWYAFDPASLYRKMGPTEIALTQLLAYLSSCCNPITYCFMNEKFRNAFLSAFGCGPQGRGFGRGPNRSTDMLSASFNDSFNLGRRSVKGLSRRRRGKSFHKQAGSASPPMPSPSPSYPLFMMKLAESSNPSLPHDTWHVVVGQHRDRHVVLLLQETHV